jgi:hypothetical protein
MTINPPVGLLEEVGGTGFQLVSGVWVQQAVLPKRLRANSKRIITKFNFTRNWFRVCSVTAKMFEHRSSGKNLNKRFDFFSNFDQGHIR